MHTQWLEWFCEAGGTHLTKPGWSKPHTHSNPTNLALFRHKVTLYRFNQGGSYYCRGAQMGAGGGWAPFPPHFNHWVHVSNMFDTCNTQQQHATRKQMYTEMQSVLQCRHRVVRRLVTGPSSSLLRASGTACHCHRHSAPSGAGWRHIFSLFPLPNSPCTESALRSCFCNVDWCTVFLKFFST